jgi:hypothetical protein
MLPKLLAVAGYRDVVEKARAKQGAMEAAGDGR